MRTHRLGLVSVRRELLVVRLFGHRFRVGVPLTMLDLSDATGEEHTPARHMPLE